MAYNLQPLITILEQILNREQTRWNILDHHNKSQLEALLQTAASLQQILEKPLLTKMEITLENQIRDAAHKAEDILESRMVDQILSTTLIERLISWCKYFTFSSPDLHRVMQNLDSATEQVVKLVELEENKMRSGGSSSGGASDPNSKSSVVVGVDEDLMQLTDRLTWTMQTKLEIVPIVGMGGIGKTTIARKLYHDSSIISRFQYARGWATISQDYNMKAILTSLLRCVIGKEFEDRRLVEKESDELKDILYRSLYGRRYMIVLDDIWNIKFWDEIRRYFPDNDNGSRIVITTRESHVAGYIANSNTQQHEMQLLSESASWALLRRTVFGEEEENWPDVLEEIGRKIATDCGGLPLAITVIGGLLSKLERSEGVWHRISTDVRGAIAKSDEQFSNILSLSYDHLPNHLKPCFLYMGAFPEDYKIDASAIIRMWVAEGFVVKSNGNSHKSLEEEAEDYLKALVERNLVSVKERMDNEKAKSYNVHDLLRDLCIRKGEEDEFLHVMNEPKDKHSRVRRLIVHNPHVAEGDLGCYAELMSRGRSFICFGRHGTYSFDYFYPNFLSELGLIRVLNIKKREFAEFPEVLLQLVNLRYLAFRCYSYIPREISRLQNLQTLIAKRFSKSYCSVPCDIIRQMPELRHLKSTLTYDIKGENTFEFVQKNLQTLFSVNVNYILAYNDFFNNIPNIIDLGMVIDDSFLGNQVVYLDCLHKLQTLRCSISVPDVVVEFPNNLRNMHLIGAAASWALLTALYALPNLELLELRSFDFLGKADSMDEEWEMKEGDVFRSLRFLLLNSCYLVRWKADETNFPRLRRLVLKGCDKLEEIPSGIGEIPTLEEIEVRACNDSVVKSAEQIVEEQQSEYGNYQIQLTIS